MCKKTLYIITFLLLQLALHAQDSVVQRVILIGDAGEMDGQQKAVIPAAADKIIIGKTTVLYLGDNIYPHGMALPGNGDTTKTQNILRSQFQPMRSKGAAVYFIPGNHDWDRMGPKGLAKIKAQWRFLNEQQDSLLKLVPENGCPDPYEINVSDSLVIIAFDSEWWLFPFSKDNAGAACECNTKDEIVARIQELVYRNRYKVILLADHHPFQSYGRHGGHYSWKDHLFPLTAVNKDLYIPLPVVGSLYPLLRKTFTNPEDIGHPLYRNMIKRVDGVLDSMPNVVHVAGHEHTMQFIKNDKLQVVSGSGAKKSFTVKGKDALFAQTVAGFVTADLLIGNSMRFTYYTYTEKGLQQTFNYTQPYTNVKAQEEAVLSAITGDSITIKPDTTFNEVSGMHRFLFGENYRKEYAAATTVPVLRISEIKGGLTVSRLGGGHQSKSLRLKDKDGKEWALRSVEKYPDVLLPEQLRETFAKDLLKDNMSSQHPFAALIVPPIANAVKVPHSNPVIGWVAPDKNLGVYAAIFANTLCLLEEREPAGKSDNTEKMFDKLDDDNDNRADAQAWLRARLLDVLIGDWDRHADQWRWLPEKTKQGTKYIAVPRDRDQVFFITDGIVPKYASAPWVLPFLQGYGSKVKDINTFFWESRVMNSRILTSLNQKDWQKIADKFVAAATDSVLQSAVQQLPKPAYDLRHDMLFAQLKSRRDKLPEYMNKYYLFLNKVVDIKASNKNELIQVQDADSGKLAVTMHKISKQDNIKEELFNRVFDPSVTKEIRIYTGKGDDSVVLDNKQTVIKLRIIGGKGHKVYNVINTAKKVQLYENADGAIIIGDATRFSKHYSEDSLNTAYVPTDLYNKTAPLLTAGYNADDGLLIGAGIKHIHKGFRKLPYASMQTLTVSHAFATSAFRLRYRGEWLQAFGKADFTLLANVYSPDNTANYFGRGNETVYNKTGDFRTYYRTRFDLYTLMPAIRWKSNGPASVRIGPSLQYYHFDSSDNVGRFINTPLKNANDSSTYKADKTHLGLVVNYVHDTRSNQLLPAWGTYINVRVQGYTGLNKVSQSFAQLIPEVALYKSITNSSSVVIAERIGGGVTVGKPAFYQSVYLGGQENLLGYRQYRFAGDHMLYNNLETRIKLANFGGYIVPGQFGIMGFYDVGRVWVKGDNSSKWHSGYGGGIYFVPAGMAVLQAVAGFSKEGFYPYVLFGMRF